MSPLWHKGVGDTGAAGENPSYPQQQLLLPLWVSKDHLYTTMYDWLLKESNRKPKSSIGPSKTKNKTFYTVYLCIMSLVCPGQGLTQVIEKAETSLGIPSPTELSAQVEEEEKQQGKTISHFSVSESL